MVIIAFLLRRYEIYARNGLYIIWLVIKFYVGINLHPLAIRGISTWHASRFLFLFSYAYY